MSKRMHVTIGLECTEKQWEALSRAIDSALVGKIEFSTTYQQAD